MAIAPEAIKRIREGAHVSQPVFARFLNTSESTVQKWEAGTKRSSGMALELLVECGLQPPAQFIVANQA